MDISQVTPELQERYERNRLAMMKVKHNSNIAFGLRLAIALLFFFFAIYAVAKNSQREDLHGAEYWYYGMQVGAIQIIFALVVIVLNFWAGMRSKYAGVLLLGFSVGLALYILFRGGIMLSIGNLLLAGSEAAVEVWFLANCMEEERLKREPGYPQFSLNADIEQRYEAPAYVTQARRSEHMDEVETPVWHDETERAAQNAEKLSEDMGLSEMETPRQSPAPQKPAAPQSPAPEIAVEQLGEFAQEAQPGRAEESVSEHSDVVLEDMAREAVSGRKESGQPLPDAEEVRQRLRRMRDEQQK